MKYFSIKLWLGRFLLFCLLLLSMPESPWAQTRDDQLYIFADLGAGVGDPHHYGATLRVLFRRHHEVNVGYKQYFKRAPLAPKVSGLLGNSYPQVYLQGLTLGYNYVLYPKGAAADLIRFALGIEFLEGNYLYPGNFQKTSYLLGPNVVYDQLSERGYGLALRAGTTFSPGKIFGLNLGAFALFGKISGGGLYTGMDLGYVSSRKVAKRKGRKQQIQ